jgi:hypothetical protein
MAALDHLVVAAQDLDAGVRLVADLTGIEPVPGGPHPGIGTRNALLSFGDGSYLEIIGIDREQPEPPVERPFALDRKAGPRLAGYAIRPAGDETIESVAAQMAVAGFDPGKVAEMSRVRPDGEELHWRLTLGGEPEPPAQGHLPFVIDWGTTQTPAATAPRVGALRSLELAHPDPAVRGLAAELGVGVVVSEGPPRLTAVLDTPAGVVRLMSDSEPVRSEA